MFLFRLLPGNHRIADNLLSVTRPAVVCSAGSVLVRFGYTGIIYKKKKKSRVVTKQLSFPAPEALYLH